MHSHFHTNSAHKRSRYISIISFSMQSITEARQQWRDLCVECTNIDAVLALPDATPLQHTADGSIQLTDASFGWPMKPPAKYRVKTDGALCSSVTEGDQAGAVPLRAGDLVVGVDGQTKGREQVPAAPYIPCATFVCRIGVQMLMYMLHICYTE